MNETVSIIQAEEGRKCVMLETRIGNGSALVTQTFGLKESRPL